MHARKADLPELLSTVPLFADLPKQHLRRVAAACSRAEYSPGFVILQEGEGGASQMLIIVDGTARIVRKGKRVATVGPGDFVGEMSLIDGYPRSASVVAETAVEALTLSSAAFKRLVAEVPAFAWRLLQTQTQRIRAFDTRLETLR